MCAFKGTPYIQRTGAVFLYLGSSTVHVLVSVKSKEVGLKNSQSDMETGITTP